MSKTVIHNRFGKGTIKKDLGDKVLVKFKEGEKELLKKFSNLKNEDGTLFYKIKDREKIKPKKLSAPKIILKSKKTKGEKKREKERKALNVFDKLSNLQKIKKGLLYINGSVQGDRNSMSYQIWEELLSNCTPLKKEDNPFVYDVSRTCDKYMKCSEKQAYVLARYGDEIGYNYESEKIIKKKSNLELKSKSRKRRLRLLAL